ncbi:nucleotidyltransferase family protein [Barrientosiimonas humi]|uniref:nucleotidyltransferase family protein n=1 Tax=Barrientosiimonas humi TaxID=999931 RepID=UPI00370DD4E8
MTEDVPVAVRVRLAHGVAQRLADQYGVDLLHLKGPAAHVSLRDPGRQSLDADVLVRPAHVDRLLEALLQHGWVRVSGFDEGSAFGHAFNLRHEYLGLLDLHRSWPGFGIDATEAFDRLWGDATRIELAHVPCPVPAVPAQRFILLLHAARSGGTAVEDHTRTWLDASDEERAQVRALAREFDAEVALAAATGELEQFRHHPDYRLWRHFSERDPNRFHEWAGRFQSARGPVAKARVARAFVSVNPDLLREELGREPTRSDYARANLHRIRTAFSQAGILARRGLQRGKA